MTELVVICVFSYCVLTSERIKLDLLAHPGKGVVFHKG